MPGGGTGFEQLIPPEQAPPNPQGKYVLEACMPGQWPNFGDVNARSLSSVPGDLVLIHGSVLHKSERNTSPHTRFAYTFHMIESPPYAEYDAKNWLQPTPETPFPHILDTPNPTVVPIGA